MIINLIIILLLIFLLLLLSMIWPPDSPWAPWWQVDKKTARRMCKLAKVKSKDVVYDLGSGDGTSLLVAAEEFHAHSIGIEVDPLRILIATIKRYQSPAKEKITFKRNNFFSEDLSEATVIFMYLVPKTLYRLRKKLLKELRPGTRIVTVSYEIPGGLTKKSFSNEYFMELAKKKTNDVHKNRKLFFYRVPKVINSI